MVISRGPDKDVLPLFGTVTGIALPCDSFRLCEGVELHKGVFEIFGAPMLAFAESPMPGAYTPGPWIAVRGGFHFKSRAELAIRSLAAFDGFPASQAMWVIAALLRLRVDAPVRINAVANVRLASLQAQRDSQALAFEASPFQLGLYRTERSNLGPDELRWLSASLPVAVRLLRDERFNRAFTLYDSATWAGRMELATILLWTSVEVLFDLGGDRNKTRAICSALADYAERDARDRDRTYGLIRDLYGKRGSIVHAGRKIDHQHFIQSYRIIREMFRTVLHEQALPFVKRTAH